MEGLTLAQLTTTAGLTSAAALLSELFWRTVQVSPATKDRFGPITAVLIGIGCGVIAGALLGQSRLDLAQTVVNGVLGGLAAIGVHDIFASRAGIA